MKRLGLVIMITAALGYRLSSQCNTTLMELAAAKSGTDALFIRDFRVKLEEGSMKRPSPVKTYQIYLKEGTRYRFNVANANEYEGRVILQLMDRNRMLGSTYEFDTRTDLGAFDYLCEKTGTFQVLMSFMEGKKGCAVGIMSLVLTDSAVQAVITGTDTLERYEMLYNGIKNELHIAATDIPGGSLEVSISQGSVAGSDGRYIARVNQEGFATIVVVARDRWGKVTETDSTRFRVVHIPVPSVTFCNYHGGIISTRNIEYALRLELVHSIEVDSSPYEITGFTISAQNPEPSGLRSYNGMLTNAQRLWLQKLKPGDHFVIRDIMIRGPDGTTHMHKPLQFSVE